MTHKLASAIRQHADNVQQSIAKPRTTTISSYDPDRFAVKVLLVSIGDESMEGADAGEEESGWIPLAAVGVGDGFGFATGPNIGDMVEVSFTGGSTNAPKIIGRYYSNLAVPPPVPAGETWIIHQSGSFFKINTAGQILMQDKAGSTATLNGDGTGQVTFASGYTINANTTIKGTLTVTDEITGEGGMAISGTNSNGQTSTVTGNMNIVGDVSTTGALTNNGLGVGSTHQHSNGNGGANTGVPVN